MTGREDLFAFLRRPGWRVHKWTYPVVWWARRKPRSRFRQWVWDRVDAVRWAQQMRYRDRLRRMNLAELEAHLEKRYRRG